ncbi:cell division protein ZapC [Providencia rettgeri]|uniref:cell division protein ZapC n=1 Tax=Providencia rettgeri TaxID=587 RepID=UPI001EE6FFB1|nr:cell division protein ZapC [Providencia rettgeri]MCG5369018.1 cell division protein ZapC [Providencia rettgeri]
MNIKPDDHWRWYFDHDHNRVMLDLANGMIFRSCFPAKMLTVFARNEMPFSIEDAGEYYLFDEQAKRLNITQEERAELVLNSLVAFRFLKPQMPKSWYFSSFHYINEPKQGQIIQVCLENTNQYFTFIIAEAGPSASLCLLAEPILELPDRTLRFSDPIKIMNDRMLEYSSKVKRQLYGNAI